MPRSSGKTSEAQERILTFSRAPEASGTGAPLRVMRYVSVCSGIEAASEAWKPLGWEAILLSEIEVFPRAVLEARQGAQDLAKSGYTADTGPALWGDFTALRPRHFRRFDLPFPDVVIGGTPCQAFSVAGVRKGLADARGNLTLTYVRLIHALRNAGPLRYAIWENVPGVLSMPDNAFGCFLGGLVGADAPLCSPLERGRWPNAGMVAGPIGRAAWRILDAQHFGLAQRRKRVFVVADFGDGTDPAAILFERKSMQGNPPTRRQQGQGVTGPVTASSGDGSSGKHGHGWGQQEWESGFAVAHALRAEGHDVSEDGTASGACGANSAGIGQAGDPMFTLDCTGAQATAFALRGREGGAMPEFEGECAGALRAANGGSSRSYIAFGGNRTSGALEVATARSALGVEGRSDFESETLIAFDCKASGQNGFGVGEIAPTLRAMGHTDSHQNAGGQIAVAFAENSRAELRLEGGDGQTTGALKSGGGKPGQSYPALAGTMGVRRITPNEAEKLQGFPVGYTLIKMSRNVRGKVDQEMADYYRRTSQEFEGLSDDDLRRLAADGPRYRALGNSFAVPVVRWIGERIQAVENSHAGRAA